jgi:hypothetical protein
MACDKNQTYTCRFGASNPGLTEPASMFVIELRLQLGLQLIITLTLT